MESTAGRSRRVLLRDFLIFQLKLVLDSLKDLFLLQISVVAVVFDLLFGRRGRPLLFYDVLRLSERFDLWLNLHGAAEEAGGADDGLFGASDSGADSLVGKLEQIVTGKVEDRRRPASS